MLVGNNITGGNGGCFSRITFDNDINPSDIESVNVLKGASARHHYMEVELPTVL